MMPPSPSAGEGLPLLPSAATARAERYPHVFRPIRIGGCEISNRIYISALTTNFGIESSVTERHVAFLEERSRGGVGLIVSEALEVHPSGLSGPGRLHISQDHCVNGLSRLAAAVHRGGSRFFAQLTHSGYTLAWAPSATGVRPWDPVPHAMTRSEIEMLVECFAGAASRVVASGFDGLQIHMGHGHLLHRFLSPVLNTRSDAYGGSYDNRIRLPLRVLEAVRESVGPDFPVGIRISSDELTALGPRLEEMRAILTDVLAANDLQFVDISQSGAGHHGLQLPDMPHGPTPFLPLARSYAGILGRIPLLTACRFTEVAEAEAALATGEVAMVGMSRAHIADPQVVSNALHGRDDQTRPCVACNYCAAGTVRGEVLSCMVNAAAGREGEEAQSGNTTAKQQRVLVIGGGPAGLEFARNAAELGSAVTVWEGGTRVGGELLVGAQGFGRGDLGKLADFLKREIKRLGVTVELEHFATAAEVQAADWDVVVVATGARRATISIAGWGEVADVDDALRHPAPAGRVVIIDYESSWRAAAAIETVSTNAAVRVTVVTPQDRFLDRINGFSRDSFLYRTAQKELDVHTMSEPVSFDQAGALTIRSRLSGATNRIVGITSIYQAMPRVSDEALAEELRDKGMLTLTIGDALVAGDLRTAIHSGYATARRLGLRRDRSPSDAAGRPQQQRTEGESVQPTSRTGG